MSGTGYNSEEAGDAISLFLTRTISDSPNVAQFEEDVKPWFPRVS